MAEFNVKNALKSLYKKGYLMEYISEQAPPIYTLTSKSYEINRIKNQYIYYRTTDLLRLVAANQLWLKLSKIWTTAIWDLSGDYPIIKKGQGQFIIAAPRLSEGDNVYALRAFNYIDRSDIVKLIIVAASKEQALEIAHNTIPTDFVRYTWDTELKEEVNFYIFKSHNMIPDIAFKNSIAKTS